MSSFHERLVEGEMSVVTACNEMYSRRYVAFCLLMCSFCMDL